VVLVTTLSNELLQGEVLRSHVFFDAEVVGVLTVYEERAFYLYAFDLCIYK
jgi:hypothetical protein